MSAAVVANAPQVKKLRARGLRLVVDGESHADDIDLELESGRIHALLGRTLSGKTTLLKMIAGLIRPDAGSLHLDGADFSARPVWKRNVAMVYQQFINYPHLTVHENVMFPLRRRRDLSRAQRMEKVERILSVVGLADLADRKIQSLSGGQQQRVALARSLVKEADILLLDEPLVNLDYKLREQLREEFKAIFEHESFRDSILIYATTDPVEAMELGDEIIVLDEGRVLQHDSPKNVFEFPASVKVAEVANDPGMNFMPARLEGDRIFFAPEFSCPRPAHLRGLPEGKCLLGLRPPRIRLSEDGFPCTIVLSEISGSETFVHLQFGEHCPVMAIETVQEFALGAQARIAFESERFFAFAADGSLLVSPYGEVARRGQD